MMPNPNTATPRKLQEQKYASARTNLGMMLILTVVNIVLLFVKADTMLLFSATFPYFTSILAAETMALGLAEYSILFTILVAATVICVTLYFLCWLLSKKHVGWMIAALVLFSLDTVFMIALYVLGEDASGVLDAFIHAWVIYYLVVGVISGTKLKRLPEDSQTLPDDIGGDEEEMQSASSVGLYPADESVKSRILAQGESAGYHILYRRVKRVNELVINGYVYDTYEAVIEQPHTLCATLNGTDIECGTDASSRIFIRVNGETVTQKFRIV